MGQGKKYDEGKPSPLLAGLSAKYLVHPMFRDLAKNLLDFYFYREARALLRVLNLYHSDLIKGVEALAFGAKKYGAYNFRNGIAYSRIINACLRHAMAHPGKDEESQLPHEYHAMACLLMLADIHEQGDPKWDDRPTKN